MARPWFVGLAVVAVLIASAPALGAVDPKDFGIAVMDSPLPAIHGPRVVGTTPGRPFLFLIPATGSGPLRYEAQGLPAGLKLDAAAGIISGAVEKEGVYAVKLRVSGPAGAAARTLNIVAGPGKLALTPPMGWNSWNVWGLAVDDDKVRAAADAMIASGLAAHGYQYVNIDDGWEAGRGADGEIMPNEKFPDLKALADYVHERGLKLGIYTTPGPKTCGGYEGSYGHEEQDLSTYARWGMDYLKYDWCTAGRIAGFGSRHYSGPYVLMGEALEKVNRDIVYCIDPAIIPGLQLLAPTASGTLNSRCKLSRRGVWCWGEQAGGNLWRTTLDINDTWARMAGIGFGQNGLEDFAGPGHWTDPDMLVVGRVGWGPKLHDSRLTPDEQITHLSLWCLLAAPLLIGCDMSALDPLTLALLTNDEALEIDQDPLGRQASRKSQHGPAEVWARPLWDGTVGVGLFNLSAQPRDVTARWSELGLAGPQPVRDLWRRQDLGGFESSFTARVPGHGAVLLKVGKPQKTEFSLP